MNKALMAAMLVALVLSNEMIAESPLEVEAAGARSDFVLSLDREYGRARFRRCRLGIVVFENRGSSQLWCEHNAAGNVPALLKREELSSKDALRLMNLVERASLYEGGRIGVDTTPNDGIFETLKLTSQGRTVVLVTSGNTTFERNPARKELLLRLYGLHKTLK